MKNPIIRFVFVILSVATVCSIYFRTQKAEVSSSENTIAQVHNPDIRGATDFAWFRHWYVGRQRIIPKEKTRTENGGLLLIFNGEKKLLYSYYIPNIGWNSLAIMLFIRGENTEAFKNVYTATPEGIDMPPEIKIWEINYPADTHTIPKYLATEPNVPSTLNDE